MEYRILHSMIMYIVVSEMQDRTQYDLEAHIGSVVIEFSGDLIIVSKLVSKMQ